MQYPTPGDNFPDYTSSSDWEGRSSDAADTSNDSSFSFGMDLENSDVTFKITSDDPADPGEDGTCTKAPPKKPKPPRPPPPRKSKPDSSSSSSSKSEKVADLVVQKVRWLYREEKKWVPFIGYDSCQMEWKYRQAQLQVKEDEEGMDVDIGTVAVRGGLYEVDVAKRQCHAIYWSDDTVKVMRGTWFYSSGAEPIEEGMANDIEKEHLDLFTRDNPPEPPAQPTKGAQKAMHELYFKDCHVDWYSKDAVYFYSNSTSSRIARSIGNTLGFSKASTSGYKLMRGYPTPASLDDKPPPISHLVFVVHGVGYVTDKKAIIKNCSDLRKSASKAIAKHLPDLISPASTQRVEFLPVEWRSSLKLDNGMVSAITPYKLKGLRVVLNSTGMDVLYYSSPLYRSEIIQCVQAEVNNLYEMFRQRNEGFEPNGGKISIFSHSLGSVIMYDIITGWNPIHLYDHYLSHEQSLHPDLSTVSPDQHDLVAELHQARIRVSGLEKQLLATNQIAAAVNRPKLNFKVENYFCVGSPLAVFLALRGVRPQGNGSISHIIPKAVCSRLFNIYYPCDPVAYRLEPLILRHYSTICPLQIHRFEGKQVAYHTIKTTALPVALKTGEEMKGIQESDAEMLGAGEERTSPGSSTSTSPQHLPRGGAAGFTGMRAWFSKTAEKSPELEALEDMERAILRIENMAESNEKVEEDEMESVELEHRVDYELKESNLGSSYLSALTSHTSYWTAADVGLFVVSQLFPEYAFVE
ncbi:phospholipase DDHD1 [Strongylocentrotus purpuratus]|uniref:DDHD domain-containing protein n=1 Tax=Strongylocentrotus purpuratus TaxID=7668 RepID=A0A7M7PUN8_STRPU|nr:phospholipase DDHD1 [Strongylocentrotus purpuratus]